MCKPVTACLQKRTVAKPFLFRVGCRRRLHIALLEQEGRRRVSRMDFIGESSSSPSSTTKTYWRRVRYNEELGVPWELQEFPGTFIFAHIRICNVFNCRYCFVGRGCAAFATRSFKKGELICSEFPLVWIHGHHPFNEDQVSVRLLQNHLSQSLEYSIAMMIDVGHYREGRFFIRRRG